MTSKEMYECLRDSLLPNQRIYVQVIQEMYREETKKEKWIVCWKSKTII